LSHTWADRNTDWRYQINGDVSRETIEHYNKMIRVHNHAKTWEEIRKRDGVARYVTKYAIKQSQKTPPKGVSPGRMWGTNHQAKDEEGQTVDVTEEELRIYLKNSGHRCAEWDILPKYIFDVDKI
jgi:hypothetical protein